MKPRQSELDSLVVDDAFTASPDAPSYQSPRPFDPCDPLQYRIVTGDINLTMRELLEYFLDPHPRRSKALRASDIISLRRDFLTAGIEALEVRSEASKWIHFGLKTAESRAQADLYNQLAGLARQMFQDGMITNFFFMHKPPGMRIRFEMRDAGRDKHSQFLRDHLTRWQREGLINGIADGLYEPEARLFGGPVSMRSVHKLFTADSFAWIDYHVLAHNKRNVGPAWLLSLLMLRALFGGLGITDWEDIGVWDTIRSKLGRNLRGGALSEPEFAESASGIRELWAAPRSFLDGSFPDLPAISDNFERTAVSTASNWQTEYFATGNACIGPRAAAALFAIFHWNRAGMSSVLQAIIAETLAQRGPS